MDDIIKVVVHIIEIGVILFRDASGSLTTIKYYFDHLIYAILYYHVMVIALIIAFLADSDISQIIVVALMVAPPFLYGFAFVILMVGGEMKLVICGILKDIGNFKLNRRLKRYTRYKIGQVVGNTYFIICKNYNMFTRKPNPTMMNRGEVDKLVQLYILKKNLRLLFVGRYKNPASPFCKNRLPLDIFRLVIDEHQKEIKSVGEDVKFIEEICKN